MKGEARFTHNFLHWRGLPNLHVYVYARHARVLGLCLVLVSSCPLTNQFLLLR